MGVPQVTEAGVEGIGSTDLYQLIIRNAQQAVVASLTVHAYRAVQGDDLVDVTGQAPAEVELSVPAHAVESPALILNVDDLRGSAGAVQSGQQQTYLV